METQRRVRQPYEEARDPCFERAEVLREERKPGHAALDARAGGNCGRVSQGRALALLIAGGRRWEMRCNESGETRMLGASDASAAATGCAWANAIRAAINGACLFRARVADRRQHPDIVKTWTARQTPCSLAPCARRPRCCGGAFDRARQLRAPGLARKAVSVCPATPANGTPRRRYEPQSSGADGSTAEPRLSWR